MLLGFVQKLGHENEKLIAGAISASWYEEEIGLAALEAANDQIEVSLELEDGLSYHHGSGSEDKAGGKSDYFEAICLLTMDGAGLNHWL